MPHIPYLGQAINSAFDPVRDKIRQSGEQASTQAGTTRVAADKADYSQKTYSFSDVQAALVLPFTPRNGLSSKIDLPGLVLLSWSSHRDTYPVVSASRKGIKGYTSGHNVYGGTIGFNLPGQDPFQNAISAYCSWVGNSPEAATYTHADELPPVDLNLVFYDKYGNAAAIVVRAMKIIDGSYNLSVQDIQFTSAFSFICASISNLTEIASEERVNRMQAGADKFLSENVNKSPWNFIIGNTQNKIWIPSNTNYEYTGPIDFLSRKAPP